MQQCMECRSVPWQAGLFPGIRLIDILNAHGEHMAWEVPIVDWYSIRIHRHVGSGVDTDSQ